VRRGGAKPKFWATYQLPLADLLRRSIYGRHAGYEGVNDAERLCQDPTFRLIGSEKIPAYMMLLTRRLPCDNSVSDP
jgi:hypothetical protein